MATVSTVGPRLGVAATCVALGLAVATYYRRRCPRATPPRRPSPPRTLAAPERAAILAVLHTAAFVDLAPAQIYARLLDAGRYLCSERTMYRLLAAHHEVRERRDQLRHPRYAPRSCSPPVPTSSGAGTSPNCSGRRSGRTSTST